MAMHCAPVMSKAFVSVVCLCAGLNMVGWCGMCIRTVLL